MGVIINKQYWNTPTGQYPGWIAETWSVLLETSSNIHGVAHSHLKVNCDKSTVHTINPMATTKKSKQRFRAS